MADSLSMDGEKTIAGVPMEYRPRGLTDVKKQVSSIKGMLVLATLALVVLTALNLGMVVAGVYITRQFKLTTGADGNVHLAKRGTNKIIHVGQSTHENIPLDSSHPDDFFKKLDSVTMNFNKKASPDARRTLSQMPGMPGMPDMPDMPGMPDMPIMQPTPDQLTLPGMPGMPDMQAFEKHTVHAKVQGFQRVACDDCASGTQVKLNTLLGDFIVKDKAVVPLLDATKFLGLDTKAFREHAARNQGISQARIDAWNHNLSDGEKDGDNDSTPSTRRSLSSVEHHGSWDAGFNDNIVGGNHDTSFAAHYDNNWTSSGGSKTDLTGVVNYDFNSGNGNAHFGISHSW